MGDMLDRIDQILNKISFTKKMVILFLGCSLVPLFFQTFYNLTVTEENIQAELAGRLENSLQDRMQQINAQLNDVSSLTLKYNNDEQIYDWLETEYATEFDYFISYQAGSGKINTELLYHPQIQSIVFYTDNETVFNGAVVQTVDRLNVPNYGEQILESDRIPLGRVSDNISLGLDRRQVRSNAEIRKDIVITRELRFYPQYAKHYKKLMITLNIPYMNRLLAQTDLFDYFYVVDDTNRVLFSTQTVFDSGQFVDFYSILHGPDSILLSKRVSDFPLTIYGVYDSNILAEQFRQSRLNSITIFLIGLAVALVFIFLVGQNITRRTRRIITQTGEIAEGRFVLAKDVDRSRDEIGLVEQSMNQLSLELQDLIEREYKSEIYRAQLESETVSARLHALQSQVNPHFLFNALESVRLQAQAKNETETATMIKYMSRMFRYLIDWTEEVVPLAEDMRFLEEFLAIQEFRFGDEFTYQIDVTPAAMLVKLPKMLIQPLVENACVHGAESASGLRRVEIDVHVEDQDLVIRVWDNGQGIDEFRLDEIRRRISENTYQSRHLGLNNVYQRLRLYYGDQFDFVIQSDKGQGTTCSVRIPLTNRVGGDSTCTPS